MRIGNTINSRTIDSKYPVLAETWMFRVKTQYPGFPTSVLHSAAELFVMLRQQCGTVCRRKSHILRFHSKHSSLGSKHTCTINRSAVDRVTEPNMRFDVSVRRHMMRYELCIIIIINPIYIALLTIRFRGSATSLLPFGKLTARWN